MVLIYSEDVGQINFEIEKLLKNNKQHKYVYDENWEDIIQQIDQLSFFEDDFNCAIIIKNVNFISNPKITNDEKLFLDSLYYSNKKIIITCISSKIEFNQKKYFENIIEIKKLNKFTMKEYINKVLSINNLKLDENLINYLCSKLPANGSIINSEIEKILCFPKNEITIDLLERIVDEDINENIFKLLDNFLLNNYNEMIEQLNYFSKLKIDFYDIFNIFVSQLYSLKLYIKHFNDYHSFEQICKDFGVMKFQVEKWAKLFYKLDSNYIEILLKNLLELEKDVLSNKRDLTLSIKSFLLKGINHEN